MFVGRYQRTYEGLKEVIDKSIATIDGVEVNFDNYELVTTKEHSASPGDNFSLRAHLDSVVENAPEDVDLLIVGIATTMKKTERGRQPVTDFVFDFYRNKGIITAELTKPE